VIALVGAVLAAVYLAKRRAVAEIR